MICRQSFSNNALTVLFALAALQATAAPPPQYINEGGPGWWRVSPKETFYRTVNDPQAVPANFFLLGELPFGNPSQPLFIEVFGDYRRTATGTDTERVLHGVFTKTPTIQVATLQRRLVDAIRAPADLVISGPTYHQSLPTDIPEDFRFVRNPGVKYSIAIPAGAQWVALCVPDSYYSDNSDPDDDLWIRFSRQ